MKIKLIQPARKPEWKECRFDYKTTCNLLGFKAFSPPLNLQSIAAFTPSDVEVIITDENVEEINFDEDVDLVGITGMTCVIPRSYEIADEFRKRGVLVVMGGIHVSMLPEEAIQHCDSVVIGEAEEIWEQVVRDVQKKRLKRFYQPERFPDLNKPLILRWDLVNNKQYMVFPLQAGRGCPYDCDFCSVKVFNGRRYRHKSIEQVVREVEALQRIDDEKVIFICDDNLLAVPEYAEGLMKALIPLRMRKWVCQVSINRLKDDKLLDLMNQVGSCLAFLGFESVSQKSLDVMNKSQINRLGEYKEIIDKVYAHGIAITGGFMFGSDGEEKEIFEETAKFINEMHIALPYVSIKTPLPGTKLFKRLYQERRIIHQEWNKYDTAHVVFKPHPMTKGELRRGWEYVTKNTSSYDNLYQTLSYLWDRNIYTIDDSNYTFKDRSKMMSILRNHLNKADKERKNFVAKCLEEKHDIMSISSIIDGLSLHDYAYKF